MSNDETFDVIPLWVTPLYVSTIKDASLYSSDLSSVEWKRPAPDNGFVSFDTFILDRPEFKDLKNKVNEHLKKYAHDVLQINNDVEFYITNSWGLKHKFGDWAPKHFHPNSLVSGVLYLKCNNDSGSIMFHKNPGFTTFAPQCFEFGFWGHNMFNSSDYTVYPEDDMIVIFPSHLEHSVSNSYSTDERFAIAFNAFVKGDFGKENPEKVSNLSVS